MAKCTYLDDAEWGYGQKAVSYQHLPSFCIVNYPH